MVIGGGGVVGMDDDVDDVDVDDVDDVVELDDGGVVGIDDVVVDGVVVEGVVVEDVEVVDEDVVVEDVVVVSHGSMITATPLPLRASSVPPASCQMMRYTVPSKRPPSGVSAGTCHMVVV